MIDKELWDTLSISEISMEITRYRGVIDNLGNAAKAASQSIHVIKKEEDNLLAEYKAKLDEIAKRKALAVNAANGVQEKIDGGKLSIQELQKLMAQKLAAQQEAERLAEIEKALYEFIQALSNWDKVADFQKSFVLECYKAYKDGKNGFLLADEMSLGKTLQAGLAMMVIAADIEREFDRPARMLILTKKNLVVSTMRELKRWVPEMLVLPINAATDKDRQIKFEMAMDCDAVMITNYEAVNTMPQLKAIEFDIVVVDECHKLKGGANSNGPTAIWKNTKEVARNCRFIMMLSGTPMVNAVKELWSYLHIFDPDRFPTVRRFEDLVSSFDVLKGEYVISADMLLNKVLKGRCMRRTKAEVGFQLPELVRSIRFLERGPQQDQLYKDMRDKFFIHLASELEEEPGKAISASAMIARLTYLREINVWANMVKVKDLKTGEQSLLECTESVKIDEAMDIIEELRDEDEQVVLFSNFNPPMFEIQRRCIEAGYTCEIVKAGSRVGLDKDFQEKKIDVLCINLAMSEGMNLQKNPDVWPGGSSNAIFLDIWWNPSRNLQAEARIHRPGATDRCTIHILYTEDSVDAFMSALVEGKARQFADILERDELRPMSDWITDLKKLI